MGTGGDHPDSRGNAPHSGAKSWRQGVAGLRWPLGAGMVPGSPHRCTMSRADRRQLDLPKCPALEQLRFLSSGFAGHRVPRTRDFAAGVGRGLAPV